jgi:hypothetical protein
MSMGEDGAQPFDPIVLGGDKFFAQVINHYKKLNKSGYVELYYGAPTGQLAGEPPARQTDWDTMVIGEQQDNVNAKLVAVYPTQSKPADATIYLYKSQFNHRFPVRMSRGQKFLFFNPLGALLYSLEQEGNVSFGFLAELSLTHSTTDIEKVVDSSQAVAAGAKLTLPATSDQVTTG